MWKLHVWIESSAPWAGAQKNIKAKTAAGLASYIVLEFFFVPQQVSNTVKHTRISRIYKRPVAIRNFLQQLEEQHWSNTSSENRTMVNIDSTHWLNTLTYNSANGQYPEGELYIPLVIKTRNNATISNIPMLLHSKLGIKRRLELNAC